MDRPTVIGSRSVGSNGLVAGDVIADRYRLETIIGRGGMGEVWRAAHTRLSSPVAVKLLRDFSDGPVQRERFLREAQVCAAIRGPNIVEVLDFGLERGSPFIAMELLEGESLASRLDSEHRLSSATTVRILSQTMRAVGRAHRRGIVHRDLKPSNIHLVRDEDEPDEIVKVLDFGIAKLLEGPTLAEGDLTTTGTILGTTHYMSPEQARGTKELDHRADVWSLGILAFRCLTGKLPLVGESPVDLLLAIASAPMPRPSAVFAELPPAFDAWFARATRRSPDDRFDSVAEMADELALALCSA
jgi:serine/threonine-protein kinase